MKVVVTIKTNIVKTQIKQIRNSGIKSKGRLLEKNQ